MTELPGTNPLLSITNLKKKPLLWVKDDKTVSQSDAFVITDGSKNYGVVRNRYIPISYADVLHKLESSLGEKINVISYASSKENAKGILTCEIPESRLSTIKSPWKVGDDSIKMYINLVNSLNGSTKIGILVTPVVVKCMNQYRLLGRKSFIELHFRHTEHGMELFDTSTKVMDKILKNMDENIVQSNRLNGMEIGEDTGCGILQDFFDTKIITENVFKMATNNWLAIKEKKNLWTLLNVITFPITRHLERAHRWTENERLTLLGSNFYSKFLS